MPKSPLRSDLAKPTHRLHRRGNIRDAEKPTSQPGTRYALRSRIRHQACQRRMYGIRRPSSSKTSPGAVYTYYHCPYNPSNPRHAAAHPDHPATSVSIREETIMAAIAGFLDQYVFGHDRAAMLAALIPATEAQQQHHIHQRAAALRRKLAQTETAIQGLITQIERLGASTSPADIGFCDRMREQFSQRCDEQAAIKAELAAIEDTPPATGNDLDLIGELPYAPGLLASAPDHIREMIAAAFDVQCVYRPDQKQATVVVTITDATPASSPH